MRNNAAPILTPTPTQGEVKPNKPEKSGNQRNIFMGAVLDMSWQLTVVVVVPIVGGFKLDEHFHTSPTITIIGFLLAMLGTFAVMRRAVIQADQRVGGQKGRK